MRAEQERAAAEAVAPAPARVTGRAVLLVPHRSETPDEAALPGDDRKILAIVRAADGPVQAKDVGEELGLEVTARGKLEPLREADQTRRPWPAAQAARRAVHRTPVATRDGCDRWHRARGVAL
ncbi:hypothetical protein [Streptomyces antnestii]|uniref:hypothetical protein n=1 Tax=Streptomyces antnestii TaxID=2494256 RepID=UPI001CB949DF|nr:hypothetical protein [Streptomyces sp. San01]